MLLYCEQQSSLKLLILDQVWFLQVVFSYTTEKYTRKNILGSRMLVRAVTNIRVVVKVVSGFQIHRKAMRLCQTGICWIGCILVVTSHISTRLQVYFPKIISTFTKSISF